MKYYKITCYDEGGNIIVDAFQASISIRQLLRFISSHEGVVEDSLINKMVIKEITKKEFDYV